MAIEVESLLQQDGTNVEELWVFFSITACERSCLCSLAEWHLSPLLHQQYPAESARHRGSGLVDMLQG